MSVRTGRRFATRDLVWWPAPFPAVLVPPACRLEPGDELGIVHRADQEAIRPAIKSGNHITDGTVLCDTQNWTSHTALMETPAEVDNILSGQPGHDDDVVVVGASEIKSPGAIGDLVASDPMSCSPSEERGNPHIMRHGQHMYHSTMPRIRRSGSRCARLLTLWKKEECHDAISYVYGVRAGWEARERKMRNFS